MAEKGGLTGLRKNRREEQSHFGKHGARDHHAGFQAARFFTVSVAAFLFALGVLQLLVTTTSIPATIAQAISIVAATPLNFVGNKMWTFGYRAARGS